MHFLSQLAFQGLRKLTLAWNGEHILKSRPGPGPGPGPIEKVDPTPKFTASIKDSFLTNLRALVSNTTIVILKS